MILSPRYCNGKGNYHVLRRGVVPLLCFALLILGCGEQRNTVNQTKEHSDMKPLIGINTSVNTEKGEIENFSTGVRYVDAVVLAGGLPVLLPPLVTSDDISSHAELCDGFVLIGGGDIAPSRYGASPHPLTNPLPQRRENYDFALIDTILSKHKPFLAICLGCQEVNVALGGTLIQDIASETSSTIQHSTKQQPRSLRHEVMIAEGSLLGNIVKTHRLLTNSSHHQAIAKLGKGLVISARADDGIIEACELTDYPFGLCIQWHPEAMVDVPEQLALFKALIEAARNGRR